MKITFFEASPQEQVTLTGLLPNIELAFFEEKLSKKNAVATAGSDVVSVFINSEVKKDVIDLMTGVKLIVTRSTGFDHVDVVYAKQKGIQVANVPSYGSRTVAEFTFGLILNLSRNIFQARHQLLENGNFDIHRLQGFDLYGKTLGVIGTGKIGKNVIKIAQAFEMKVVATDMYPDEAFAKERGFSYLPLEQLLAQADIVTLHTPYTKESHHLINGNNIGMMKKGAYLVNTARGELVETEALIDALNTGYLSGAGLDVLEDERQLREETEILKHTTTQSQNFKTLFENHLLMNHARVILTPHIAFFTKEAMKEISTTTAGNIQAFIKGTPQNILT